MLEVEEAQARIISAVEILPSEPIPLRECIGRILRTLPLVDEATLVRLAAVDQGLLTSLVAKQLRALAFEVPTVPDAAAFFDRVEADLGSKCNRLH